MQVRAIAHPPPMGEMGEDHFNKKVDKIEGGN